MNSFYLTSYDNLTCCWCTLEARGPDNSPVDVISLLKKVFHFIHVAQNTSNHGKQHEADEIGRIGAWISCEECHNNPITIPDNRSDQKYWEVKNLQCVYLQITTALTVSVPWGHGDDSIHFDITHSVQCCLHRLGVASDSIKKWDWKAKTGQHSILAFEMRFQAVFWKNVSFNHLSHEGMRLNMVTWLWGCMQVEATKWSLKI